MKPLPALEQRMLKLGYVTLSTASLRTGIGKSTIHDAIQAKKIETHRVGKRWFVQIKSFLKWGGDGAKALWKEAGKVEISPPSRNRGEGRRAAS